MKSTTKKIIIGTLILLAIASGLLVGDAQGLFKAPKNVVYSIFAPFQKTLNLVGLKIANVVNFFVFIKEIARQNDELRLANQNLMSQLSRQQILLAENEALRKILNFQDSSNAPLVIARIISRAALWQQALVMIDKGEKQGIAKGMAVVAPPDILVGQITETAANFSFFLPLTSSQSQIQAFIQQDRVSGILKGKDSGLLSLEMVPQNSKIAINDLVVAPANLTSPKDLPIGTIENIMRNDLAVFQEVLVRPLVDMAEITLLAVIVNQNPGSE